MFAAGIAIGEALSERRARNAEQIIHDEWDAACKTCHTCDMSRTRQGS
jgi:methylmalonyl-CoA mutase N-terminal domain/subunit